MNEPSVSKVDLCLENDDSNNFDFRGEVIKFTEFAIKV